jgi:hypothetical protein
MNSGKWSILELFERFYAQKWRKQENQEKSGNNTRRRQALELTSSPFEEMRWNFTLGAPEKKLESYNGTASGANEVRPPGFTLTRPAQNYYKGTASEGLLGDTKP